MPSSLSAANLSVFHRVPNRIVRGLGAVATLLLVLLLPATLSAQTGTSGTVTSSDGWTSQAPMPQGNDLNAVWSSLSLGINGLANDVYAVGAIIHYDGTAWRAAGSGVTASYLYGIWASSSADNKGQANDMYAVGGGGSILHYDGTAWSTEASNTTNILYGVWGSSATDVYAVGAAGTILHFCSSTSDSLQTSHSNHLKTAA